MTSENELLAVTQADREAAAAYAKHVATTELDRVAIDFIVAGRSDDSIIVQAFARHRLNIRPTPALPEERVSMILDEAEQAANELGGDFDNLSHDYLASILSRLSCARGDGATPTPLPDEDTVERAQWYPIASAPEDTVILAAEHVIGESWTVWKVRVLQEGIVDAWTMQPMFFGTQNPFRPTLWRHVPQPNDSIPSTEGLREALRQIKARTYSQGPDYRCSIALTDECFEIADAGLRASPNGMTEEGR